MSTGQDRSGHRAGRRRGVRAGPAARHLQRARGAGRGQHRRLRLLAEARARGGPASRREPGAHGGHGRHRRPHPRHAGGRHRRADHDPGRQGDARPHHQHHRRAGRQGPGHQGHQDLSRSTARRRAFDEQSTKVEMFETGIKVVDLLEPYTRGRQDRPLRRRGRRQDRAHPGADQQHRQAARRHLGLRRAWASGRARATTSTTR